MTIGSFYTRFKGKAWNFFPSVPDLKGQCVQLPNFYHRDVIGGTFVGTPLTNGARDWYENYSNSAEAKKHYVRYPASTKPQDGDVLVWGRAVGGGYGHIAIWYKGRIFNQNNNGRLTAGLDPFFTTGYLGLLRPRKFLVKTAKVTKHLVFNKRVRRNYVVTRDTPVVWIPSNKPSGDQIFKKGTVLDIGDYWEFSNGKRFYRTKTSVQHNNMRGIGRSKLIQAEIAPIKGVTFND